MGFRDLESFNLALLSKQVWRLLSEPDSLCAQVLRAKYFPSGDLLNCELKKGSSYTWQAEYLGRDSNFQKGSYLESGEWRKNKHLE